MEKKAILVIDADPHWEEFRLRLQKSLAVELIQVASETRGRELMLQQQHYFLMIALSESLSDPVLTGLIAEIKQEAPLLPVFIVSRRPTVAGAVSAMRRGAQDYLPAPLTWERLKEILAPYLRNGHEPWRLSGNKGREESRSVITRDPVMLQLLRMAEAVAPTTATVLIQGESGTGKEIMARYIHAKSDRVQGPFIAVNCASLPERLLGSELFGHEKGAFTGAIMRKLGKFELAQNGTMLLDEISEMHPHLQAKLLRVLQENEIDRVGGRHPVPINVRVIATTNRNLQEAIQSNQFREDLFYRLNVISLILPALRVRRGDIPLLAEYFLHRYAKLFAKGAVKFSAQALAALENAAWPGNVRELENAVARGVLLSQGSQVHPKDILADPQMETPGAPPVRVKLEKPVTLREMEQNLIFQALDETSGNRTHAAKILGISVRTLRNKLHEYRSVPFPGANQSSQVA
ncbi:MAG: sigma-54 dependent transcriptional regulator [Syntrophales bacterium]|nr:sigma-54 dependent transcriptional regulator [Syntrophales bacterium]